MKRIGVKEEKEERNNNRWESEKKINNWRAREEKKTNGRGNEEGTTNGRLSEGKHGTTGKLGKEKETEGKVRDITIGGYARKEGEKK
jgi:hypothetical protein